MPRLCVSATALRHPEAVGVPTVRQAQHFSLPEDKPPSPALSCTARLSCLTFPMLTDGYHTHSQVRGGFG